MSRIVINDREIEADIYEILTRVKSEIFNGKLNNIKLTGDSISVPCPFHKNGQEKHNSCTIYCGEGDLPAGTFHCFTCSESGPLEKFIGACFDKDSRFGEEWLIENYSYNLIKRNIELPIIDLNEKVEKKYLDDSILEEFSSYHPYMTKRKLTNDIIKKFEIKYDPLSKSIVFPVRGINGDLVALTRRSTEGKKFVIDKGFDKSNIYLLYNIVKENIKEVVVCEGQISALTSWVYGRPAIALFGAGTTQSQIDTLNSTDIKHYILCYDGDDAGRKGAKRFRKFIRKDVFVDEIKMPEGKDINDLTKEEFDNLVYESLK